MIRSLLRIALAAALAVALALAGWSVQRPLAMMRQVGIPGWRLESGRRCEDAMGMRWRHCYGTGESSGSAREEERISFDRRTGRITELERVWQVSDSADLIRQEDSVARALSGHGGAGLECPLRWSTDGGAQRIAAWRFQEQDVRMIRSRRRGAEARSPRWVVQISGVPVGYSGCQGAVQTRRLLTPMEMLGALQRWLVGHTD